MEAITERRAQLIHSISFHFQESFPTTLKVCTALRQFGTTQTPRKLLHLPPLNLTATLICGLSVLIKKVNMPRCRKLDIQYLRSHLLQDTSERTLFYLQLYTVWLKAAWLILAYPTTDPSKFRPLSRRAWTVNREAWLVKGRTCGLMYTSMNVRIPFGCRWNPAS